MSYSNPQCSGMLWKKEHKDYEPKMAHDYKEIVFSKYIKAGAHYKLTVKVTACTRSVKAQVRHNPKVDTRGS